MASPWKDRWQAVEIPTIEKPESKIPSKCPLMKDCEKEITPDGYRYTCCTRSWITCSGASEEAKKYKAKPRDWALVQAIGAVDEEWR